MGQTKSKIAEVTTPVKRARVLRAIPNFVVPSKTRVQGIAPIFLVPPSTDIKDTIPFALPLIEGRVIKVHKDGQSVTIASALSDHRVYRFTVSLTGVAVIDADRAIRDLEELVLHKWISVSNVVLEEKITVTLWQGSVNVNKWVAKNQDEGVVDL